MATSFWPATCHTLSDMTIELLLPPILSWDGGAYFDIGEIEVDICVATPVGIVESRGCFRVLLVLGSA